MPCHVETLSSVVCSAHISVKCSLAGGSIKTMTNFKIVIPHDRRSRLREVATVGLRLGKFWCFGSVVALERCSLTEG